MKTQRPKGKTVKLNALIKMHEKNYHEAIKNNVEFDQIKIIYQTIKGLRQRLPEDEPKTPSDKNP
jgi:hypothetical protein